MSQDNSGLGAGTDDISDLYEAYMKGMNEKNDDFKEDSRIESHRRSHSYNNHINGWANNVARADIYEDNRLVGLEREHSDRKSSNSSDSASSGGSNKVSPDSQSNSINNVGAVNASISSSSTHTPLRSSSWEDRGAARIVTKETDAAGNVITKVQKKSVRDFEFTKELGDGSYSTVMLGTDTTTGTVYAIKMLDKRHIIREKKVKYVNIEKNALNKLNKARGIVHLYYTFQDQRSLYFVLEYAPNGELLSLIKKYGSLTVEACHYYSAQLIDVIDYMHSHGVVHRDIKPENILIGSDNTILVTDFGTAKIVDRQDDGSFPTDIRASSFVGTAEYVSPELLNDKYCGMPADVWAFGCIVYQMIAGKPPFKGSNEYQTFQKVIKLQYAFSAGFPTVVRDLVKRILILKPRDRLTVAQVKAHFWFRDVNWEDGSVWDTAPPEPLGPYKLSAQAMMPVPELDNGSAPGGSYHPRPSNISQRTSGSSQHSNQSSSAPNRPSSAPLAAQVALGNIPPRSSSQPYSSSIPSSAPTTPSQRHHSSSDLIPGTNIPRPRLNTRVSRARSSQKATSSSSHKSSDTDLPAMSSLDLNWAEFFRHPDERVIKAGMVEVLKYSTADFEKKFKGTMAESPLGYSNREVGNVTPADTSSDAITFTDPFDNDDEDTAEDMQDSEKKSSSSRLRNFFSYRRPSGSEPAFRSRVLVVTTFGRALLFIQHHDRRHSKYEKYAEIDLTNPQVRFVEVIGERRPKSGSSLRNGTFAIVSTSVTLAFEVQRQEVGLWTGSLANARILEQERILRSLVEPSEGGEAAIAAAGIAASKSPRVAQVGGFSTDKPINKKGRKPPPLLPATMRTTPTDSSQARDMGRKSSDTDSGRSQRLEENRILSDNSPMITAAANKAVSNSSPSSGFYTPSRPITGLNSRMLARSRNK
ncbi:DEKNAAC100109 [Brettanomyces naardenensis]|uniref:non-specific serine/threonine protein kinase n=1 Tax=Brettanomyces naardenensis TaxID=13370 RepID=A0A448YFX3_BRENA|nr:DEKNAAC100109 [Brettanomyces naardenensis]